MKKILFFLLLVGPFAMATDYFVCSTNASNSGNDGPFSITDSTGTNNCLAVGIATWNNSANTIYVPSGKELVLSAPVKNLPIDIHCDIVVEQGGKLSFAGHNQEPFVIKNGTTVIVNGDFVLTENNTILTIETGGLLIVNSTGKITNSGNPQNHVEVNGDITGSGTVEWSGNLTGTGTINGTTIGSQVSPLNLAQEGFVWDGTAWQGGTAPSGIYDRTIFNGNYSSSADTMVSSTWPSEGITINEKLGGGFYTIAFDENDDLSNIKSVTNEGLLKFVDNVTISGVVLDAAGGGQITIERNFTRKGWHHMSLPVKSGSYTLGSLVTSGFTFNFGVPNLNNRNIYGWNADSSAWSEITADTSIIGLVLNVFASDSGNSISITMNESDFNNTGRSMPYVYHDPMGNPPGNGTGWVNPLLDDGWNTWYNPVQSYLISDSLDLPADLDNSIYIWDAGTNAYLSYVPGNPGTGDVPYISPHQAFFVRSTGNSGSHIIGDDFSKREPSPLSRTSYFKTSSKTAIQLLSGGTTVKTWFAFNEKASNTFDGQFDAYYRRAGKGTPVFASVASDSTSCSVNCLPISESISSFLWFDENGARQKSFTVALDPSTADSWNTIILEDLYYGHQVDLKKENYSFTVKGDAPKQRFKVTFGGTMSSIVEKENVVAWFDGNELNVQSENNEITQVQVHNLQGVLLYSGDLSSATNLPEDGMMVISIELKNLPTVHLKVWK